MALSISPSGVAQAKSLVGSVCKKAGAIAGDGPGKSVVCAKKGSKLLWQILAPKTPLTASTPSTTSTT